MTTLPRPSADDVLDLVRKALDRDDVGGAIAALDLLKEQVDVHDVFDELDVDDQAAMLPRMEPEDSAEIMASLDRAISVRSNWRARGSRSRSLGGGIMRANR